MEKLKMVPSDVSLARPSHRWKMLMQTQSQVPHQMLRPY